MNIWENIIGFTHEFNQPRRIKKQIANQTFTGLDDKKYTQRSNIPWTKWGNALGVQTASQEELTSHLGYDK